MFPEISSALYQNRYCDQEDFDLIVSSNGDHYNEEYVWNITFPGLTSVKKLYTNFTSSTFGKILPYKSSFLMTFNVRTVYDNVDNLRNCLAKLFGNSNDELSRKNTFVCLPHKRFYYCTCSFMRNIYVFSGYVVQSNCITEISNSCLKYDTKPSQWSLYCF